MCVRPLVLKERQVTVPCGFCIECRSRYALMWALRCVHEAELHVEKCFVTLTYDPVYMEHMNKTGSLVKRDLQVFFKKLRAWAKPRKVRYYAAGEYGDRNGRPHYHALVFGCNFADKELVKPGKFPLFRSAALEELWPIGLSRCGTVSVESARYVAGYVMKKVDQVGRKKKYCSATGVELEPEFSIMSRGGREGKGLGYGWYERYGDEVHRNDSVVSDGRELPVPRYYDEKLRERDDAAYQVMKIRRERKHGRFTASRELMARELIARARLALREREL